MTPLRLLLLEDNPADRAYALAVLDGDEFAVTAVERLDEATRVMVTQNFDVALIDMTLPDGAGLAVLERIQEAQPQLPVVIFSGSEDERVAVQAVQAGAQDYLLKGHVTDAALRRALRYAVERSDMQRRLAASIDELEGQRASVIELNQLKNDLIAVLAHDIKGPLTSIVGFSELLEEGLLEGDAATDAARTIRTNAQRLATLANDVLALSRVEHGELEIADERVDLVQIARKIVELHQGEREIAFVTELESAPVRGDEERLLQVLDNLLRNAIKYSPGGEPVEIRLRRDGNRFLLAVHDRGIGIPPDEIPTLFERFTRGSNARRAKISGTGIGLFIVKMIVERHGGTIAVEGRLGEGSTFTVALPTMESLEAHRTARVTIVSADRALSRFVTYELRARGCRVREAATLDEAVAAQVRAGDVFVVDEAVASARDLRARLPAGSGVRLVGLTAEPSPQWDATLPQPFLLADLLAAVGVPNAAHAR